MMEMIDMFQGTMTAMITPFAGDAIDGAKLREQVKRQIDAGINGLVPCGTTGESPTLSHDEHKQVVELTIEAAGGAVPVIAGSGSNSTREAIELTRHAKAAGATASLQVNPYYNKPTQEGLYRHFMAIADAVELPIVLYNIPGRSAVALTGDTIVRLAAHDNIVAIKEATGSLDIASDIATRCDLTILSGDDSLTLPLMSIGGKGVISVVSNLLPGEVREMTDAGLAGDYEKAKHIHLNLFPLFKGMLSMATNPIPVKTAMKLVGLDTGDLRLPMCEMDAGLVDQLAGMLRGRGILG